MAKKGYYAVNNGRETGVFSTWEECQRHVNGYSGAVFKKFDSASAASDFASNGRSSGGSSYGGYGGGSYGGYGGGSYGGHSGGHSHSSNRHYSGKSSSSRHSSSGHSSSGHSSSSHSSSSHSSRSKDYTTSPFTRQARSSEKYYAVKSANSEKPSKVFTNWNECQEYVNKTKGVSFKKFDNASTAQQFIQDRDTPADVEADLGKLGYTVDEFASTHKASIGERANIYCDGSSLGNGKRGANAGFGVHYSDGSHPDVAAPLKSGAQTNNRAELAAVKNALDTVWSDVQSGHVKDYKICTDSEYVSKTLANHRFRDGTEANADLVNEVVDSYTKVKHFYGANGRKFEVEWVKGHSGDPGNERADELARAGANA